MTKRKREPLTVCPSAEMCVVSLSAEFREKCSTVLQGISHPLSLLPSRSLPPLVVPLVQIYNRCPPGTTRCAHIMLAPRALDRRIHLPLHRLVLTTVVLLCFSLSFILFLLPLPLPQLSHAAPLRIRAGPLRVNNRPLGTHTLSHSIRGPNLPRQRHGLVEPTRHVVPVLTVAADDEHFAKGLCIECLVRLAAFGQ